MKPTERPNNQPLLYCMNFVHRRVTSKATVATLTEHARSTRKEIQLVQDRISSKIRSGATTTTNEAITLISVAAPLETTTNNHSPPSSISTTVQYTTTSTDNATTDIVLPYSDVILYHQHRSKLMALELQKEKETELLAAQLLPILQGVAKYSKEFQGWGHPKLSTNNILVSAISGAMTNTIYKCEFKADEAPTTTDEQVRNTATNGTVISATTAATTASHDNAQAVLVRLYGEGTESFFSREAELKVFSDLSALRYGAHALLCEFENGRCERFFTGSRPMSAVELTTEQWANTAMGKEVAVFHQLNMSQQSNIAVPTYEVVVDDFLKTVKHCYSGLLETSTTTWFAEEEGGEEGGEGHEENKHDTAAKGQQGQQLKSPEEKQWLQETIATTIPEWLKRVERSLLNGKNQAVLHSKQNIVFGHNDLQPGNVLVDRNNDITFIDFEYARYVPRGYDIINLW